AREAPELQYVHLSGTSEFKVVKAAYGCPTLTGVAFPFLEAMEVALSAATLAVSRAGGSSLAELAALQVPSVLIPYPDAVENHQLHNARAWDHSGAAVLVEQRSATPESFGRAVLGLVKSSDRRDQLRRALVRWQAPDAADQIAQVLLEVIRDTKLWAAEAPNDSGGMVQISPSQIPGEGGARVPDLKPVTNTTAIVQS